jgi:hypothetical protein
LKCYIGPNLQKNNVEIIYLNATADFSALGKGKITSPNNIYTYILQKSKWAARTMFRSTCYLLYQFKNLAMLFLRIHNSEPFFLNSSGVKMAVDKPSHFGPIAALCLEQFKFQFISPSFKWLEQYLVCFLAA